MAYTGKVLQHGSQQMPYLLELERSLSRNKNIGPTGQYLVLAGSLAK